MATTEFVILAGMVVAGLLFFMIFQFFILTEEERVEEYGYKAEAEALVTLIERIDSEPNEYVLYCQYISPCDISVKNGILTYEKDRTKYSFPVHESVNVTNLKRVATVCVLKTGGGINLLPEKPVCILDNFCIPDECKEDCPDCYGPDPMCIGDGLCNKFIDENCANSIDCRPCDPKVCCPSSPDADERGCSDIKDLPRGVEECWCTNQCRSGLECNPTTEDFVNYEKACCDPGKSWNGTDCVKLICSPSSTRCYNHWHWECYTGESVMVNRRCCLCDFYEVCHPVKVEEIAKEITDCCNNKCSGACHPHCNNALVNSGLSSTDTSETRKKCYGLYTIYGLGPAARWMRGYMIHIEEPASIMLSGSTWMCTGYSIVLTTLLRSVGYEKNEVYSTCGPMHMYNLVKFPGETKYRFVDTVGNSLYISGITGGDWYGPRCSYGMCGGCSNDEGAYPCPSRPETTGRC